MKNQFESMPNPSEAKGHPIKSDEDVESLMKAFERADKEKADEPTYEDLLADAEASMNADIEEAKAKDEAEALQGLRSKTQEKMGRHESLLPAIEAKRFAPIILDRHLEDAMGMLGREQDAATLLLDPIRQELWQVFDPKGETRAAAEENRALQPMIASYAEGIRSAAKHGMAEELKRRLDAAEKPEEISKLHQLLEIIEKSE